jgi:hypothetical protein
MPWYIASAFAGYTLLLAWQTTSAILAGHRALFAIPFLLIKLCILCVAVSYWNPESCAMAKHLGAITVVIAGGLTLREALMNLNIVLLNPAHPPEADDFAIVFTILATVVCPAVVFFFAATVVLSDACAS